MRSENIIYIRQRGLVWEAFAKSRGQGILGQGKNRTALIEEMSKGLDFINEHGNTDGLKILPNELPTGFKSATEYAVVQED